MDKIIYEFDDNYYIDVDKLKNENLKEWIVINSIDYNLETLLSERNEFISNDDSNYSDYNYFYDDIDVLRAEKYEEYEEIYKMIKIIESGDYLELQEGTDDYNEFINRYRDDIIKCEVKGVF